MTSDNKTMKCKVCNVHQDQSPIIISIKMCVSCKNEHDRVAANLNKSPDSNRRFYSAKFYKDSQDVIDIITSVAKKK